MVPPIVCLCVPTSSVASPVKNVGVGRGTGSTARASAPPTASGERLVGDVEKLGMFKEIPVE